MTTTRSTATAWSGALSDDERAAVGHVARELAEHRRVGVALSGGVDSSTLLALATDTLGRGRVLALVGVSPSLAAEERAAAHDVAAFVGVPVVEVPTAETERAAYRANGPDRCFHCRDTLFTTIEEEVLDRYELDAVAYGENADDIVRRDRPGARAATEHGVLRPLAAAGIDKAAVRRIARAMNLPSADKPAAPCLASRIPHFEQVTPEKMSEIERSERALHRLGFPDCRVRHHGDVARVELPADRIAEATGERRKAVLDAVRGAGFRFVSVDLAGLQPGAFTLPLIDGGRCAG
ncbi:MAG: ATP-dependent sacrificial sulfur transferase LarE [Pseudonocardia sp.]|nr:ATP-dependent sacrificial sulfur transferase LarE [Pseudonocardia sp.]